MAIQDIWFGFRRPLVRSLGEIRFALMRSSLTSFSGNRRPRIRKSLRIFLRTADVADLTDTNPEALRENDAWQAADYPARLRCNRTLSPQITRMDANGKEILTECSELFSSFVHSVQARHGTSPCRRGDRTFRMRMSLR